jgi:hypothetical protein
MRLPLPSVACTSCKDLQHRPLSDWCVADRLPLWLPAIAVARASAARPSEALLCYPSWPFGRDPALVDEKPECGPSAGSKRTDPLMRNDGMLPLAAILYMMFHCQKQEATLTLLQVKRTRPLHLHLTWTQDHKVSGMCPDQCTMCAAPHRRLGPGPSTRSRCRCFCSLPDQGTVRRSQDR